MAVLASAAAPPAGAATLPAGFTDTLVTTVPRPTALAFTPDGALLVATQPALLRVVSGGTLLATPALDLSAVACTNAERGLLGVAVDPAFADNGFIYVYYTFNKFGSCPQNAALTPVNRVSRFVLGPENTVDRTTETVLVDNIPSPGGIHNAGDLQFGRDGNLYVSVGDGGCDYLGDSGCGGANNASRDENVLLGKVLRITPTGGIPADNPFQGLGTGRCNLTGGTAAARCQETFAWGLRNPFRIAFDANETGERLFINDVGLNQWEEIDAGIAGADYGWNVREGHCLNGSTTNCPAPPAGMTDPIYDYSHAGGCRSITGGAFVPAGVWPVAYDGAYLFADYVCGRIFALTPTGAGFTATIFADGLGPGSAVHLAFGPHGSTRALYYTNYRSGGAVQRIAYSAANRAPRARLTATPSTVPIGDPVTLDGATSSDPDPGDTLTYVWDFGDRSPTVKTKDPSISYTYAAARRFIASLTVYDSHAHRSSNTARVAIDVTPPAPSPLTSKR